MKYEISTKSDFMSGTSLFLKIPEKDVDNCAFKTIQADCPEFILPFTSKTQDGFVELTYAIGSKVKLQYLSGEIPGSEYAKFWMTLLKPLLDCCDWFMNPGCFLLSTNYLFYDKESKCISYVYIPCKTGYSSFDAFRHMTADVSKIVTVSDQVLENKVLRAIMNDFNPTDFINMLKSYSIENSDAFMFPAIDETQSTPIVSLGPALKYTGTANHPDLIRIAIEKGGVFTIGRFDSAVGKKQSSFEFEKKTKAVSRRHAAIEFCDDGYKIVDLSSSAGTFVNSKKLPPNTPLCLENGARISFGNLGADYVWEAS